MHFSNGNYTRALFFVSRADLISRSASCKYLAAHCYIKQNRYDDALGILGDKNPVHLITSADISRRKLQHVSNGLSIKQNGKLPSRIERVDRSEERDREDVSNIKFEACMCYLRGLCHAKQNAFDRAKECYKDAMRIDVQCFEAFDQLMKNSLMSPGEEWDFLETLNFDSIQPDPSDPSSAQEAAAFVRNLYTTRLSKYARPKEFATAIETLSTHYKLAENPDILLAKAEILFTSSRFRESLILTSSILENDPYDFAAIPVHLAALHELDEKNTLFLLSHDLADTHPNEPCTWLAVGTYYLTTNRIPEARGYFSKASLMDPHFGPAWVGFAHTFAAEGEHEQAISAYSTAARLFQGTHLPQLFLGMSNLAVGHLGLAREYLSTAHSLCDRDPLLLNELGVCSYQEEAFAEAIRIFQLALRIADDNEAPPQQYCSTRLNLAHALRRAGHFEEALVEFDEVIRTGMRECSVFAAKGLVLLELEQPFEATVALHAALEISPQDPIAAELLAKALTLLEGSEVLGGADEEAVDEAMRIKLAEIAQKPRGAQRTRRRLRNSSDVDVEDSMQLDGSGG